MELWPPELVAGFTCDRGHVCGRLSQPRDFRVRPPIAAGHPRPRAVPAPRADRARANEARQSFQSSAPAGEESARSLIQLNLSNVNMAIALDRRTVNLIFTPSKLAAGRRNRMPPAGISTSTPAVSPRPNRKACYPDVTVAGHVRGGVHVFDGVLV
jgi:hypothetical protein